MKINQIKAMLFAGFKVTAFHSLPFSALRRDVLLIPPALHDAWHETL
jgi:hypothetical protein